ncbi:MAG: DUF3108 domain-containing protein [Pseudomonadota bacterium]
MTQAFLRYAALLALGLTQAGACQAAAEPAGEHPSLKRAFSLPPPAELHYAIKARQKGFSISGDATIRWQVADGKYSVLAETRASFLGKIVENRSEGVVDAFGIAPLKFNEKRLRQDPYTITFDRAARSIGFSAAKLAYPILGGEQDRSSVSWQLAAIARAAPEKFTPGSEWKFFVAGRRDAEAWTFRVGKQETLHTRLGDIACVHVVRLPPPDSADQQLDIWFAPSFDWYPLRLRFADSDGDFVEQTLDQVARK